MEQSLIDACVEGWVYDSQCEGHREEWLADLLAAAALNSHVVDSIRRVAEADTSASGRQNNAWFALLGELARRGDGSARDALYEVFESRQIHTELHGVHKILVLDGEAGLRRVARHLGSRIRDDSWPLCAFDFLDYFDATHGPGRARELLEEWARIDPYIAKYLLALTHDAEITRDQTPVSESVRLLSRVQPGDKTVEVKAARVSHVLSALRSGRLGQGYGLAQWGLHATEDDLRGLFDAFVVTDDPREATVLMRAFVRRPPPALSVRFVEWFDSSNESARDAASRVLCHFHTPEVHELARRELRAGNTVYGLRLLRSSANESDISYVLAALSPLGDPEREHQVVSELLDLYAAARFERFAPVLRYVYEYSPCMHCRREAVRHMLASGTAPAWVLAECLDDADERVRRLASDAAPRLSTGQERLPH